MTATQVDLIVDLNTMDDTGLPWAYLDEAHDPAHVRPGRQLVVGSGTVRGIALVADVIDRIVHVRPARRAVAANGHLINTVAVRSS